MISWVVPTVVGREDGLARSLVPIVYRADIELIVIRDAPTCGHAWVDGARCATGDYLHFAADDIEPHPGFCEAMIEAVDKGMLPAALVLLPDGAKQSCGGAGGDVCRGDCADWQPVEWSPTPFIARDWWQHIELHAEMLARLHYSSDCLVSAILAKQGIPAVMRREAMLTHHNDPVGRLWTAGDDGRRFASYRAEHAL